MPSDIVRRVLDQIRLMTEEERAEVKALIDSVPYLPEPRTSEEGVRLALMRQGLITSAREPLANYTAHDAWQPIEVEGKPVSELLIEERR